MASGRNPCGSRATMMRSSARNTSENAPSSCNSASRSAPESVRSRECATRCRITSVSLLDWKMDPSRSSSRRSSAAFVILPLCATAMRPFVAGHRKRLRVEQRGVAGGRITRVADGQFARKRLDHLRREDIRHVAHGFVTVDSVAVAGADARALLPAMLQRVQPQIRQLRCLGVAVRWRKRRTRRGICRTSHPSLRMQHVLQRALPGPLQRLNLARRSTSSRD